MSETITSTHNAKIKELRKLAERKHRQRSGLFVAEGEDLLAEALRFGRQPEVVFCDVDAGAGLGPLLDGLDPGVELEMVDPAVLGRVSSLGSGSRVIGVWAQRWQEPVDLAAAERCLYLHEISDPGNVGTVVRSALAFDAAIVVSDRTADPYSPKAVRASMGSLFGASIARAGFDLTRAALPVLPAIALLPGRGRPLRELASSSVLFVLGAERSGLPDRIVTACDEIAHVPLAADGPESLNVAMAATLCLYEATAHKITNHESSQ